MSLLSLKDVRAGYGTAEILHGISLEVEEAEIVAIVGESGSGKSTVLKAVTALPSFGVRAAGGIIFNGRDMSSTPPEERRLILGEELCMIFQDPALSMNPIRKIRKQFLEAIRSHREVSDDQALDMIRSCFRRLGLSDVDRILESCPFELSGGMCQRAALALSMVMEPKLILADEPTSALDVVSQLQVIDELSLLRKNFGTSVVLVTHNIAAAAKAADRLVIMHDGRIVESGETVQVLTKPENEYTRRLLADVPQLGSGPAEAGCARIQLSVQNVSKSYTVGETTVEALRNVSFSMTQGEILGIVGESGSGKSTLARQILRLEEPDSGIITLNDENISSCKGRTLRSLYRKEQMVFQSPAASFNPRRTIRSTLRDTLKNLGGVSSTAEADTKIDSLMARVGLSANLADRYPFQLSGGQCQRAAIARAVAPKPELLICDEATSALDVTVQAGIVSLLRSLVAEENMSLLFISHDIALVSELCDRILVMKNGVCVESGKTCEVINRPQNKYTKILLKAATMES
mgnify:CR=1 FL=1